MNTLENFRPMDIQKREMLAKPVAKRRRRKRHFRCGNRCHGVYNEVTITMEGAKNIVAMPPSMSGGDVARVSELFPSNKDRVRQDYCFDRALTNPADRR